MDLWQDQEQIGNAIDLTCKLYIYNVTHLLADA